MKILIIEDDQSVAEVERDYLEINGGFQCDLHTDGTQGLQAALTEDYALVIVDVMLPGLSGFEICRRLREEKDTPVIIISALADDIDKVRGLGLGADDYITKPFNILEVKARIKAIMRRTAASQPKKEDSKVIEAGDLKLDCESRRLFILGKEVNLTAKEFDLLELLVNNPNKVYGRENLLNLVWGYEYPGDVRTVDVHVRRLREKIESNPSEPKYVHTKWGVGYYYSQN